MSRYIGRSYQSLQDERNRRMQEEDDGGEVEEFIDYGGPHRHCYFCYSFILCSMRYKVLQSLNPIFVYITYYSYWSSYLLTFFIAFTGQIVTKVAILQLVQRAVVLCFMAAKMKNI